MQEQTSKTNESAKVSTEDGHAVREETISLKQREKIIESLNAPIKNACLKARWAGSQRFTNREPQAET